MMIVTISRQVATNGELIGRLAAERLNLHYLDRELLEEMARRLHVDPDVVTRYDESALNPVQSVLWEWRASINEQIYLRSLREAFRHIAEEDHAVVIGRGGNLLLTGPQCLHVRIIAPLSLRTEIYLATHPMSVREAEQRIREGDRDRSNFIRKLFRQNIDDPGLYDLTLNLAEMTPEMAVEVIALTARLRHEHALAEKGRTTQPQHIEVMARHRQKRKPPMEPGEERAA